MPLSYLFQLRLFIGVILVLLLVGFSCQNTSIPMGYEVVNINETNNDLERKIVTTPETEVINSQIPEPVIAPKVQHALKVLAVPFFPQAPHANWDMPYQEACEEASMLMVAEYFSGNHQSELSIEEADQKILELIAWEEKNGFSADITSEQVITILKQYFNLTAEVVPYNPEVIKQSIDQNRLVILPAAGQLLDNPFFRQPGPIYHMLIIKGYELDEFITNDPGTRRGMSYRYEEYILSEAVHDWNGGDVTNGKKVMIIVSK